MNKDILYDVIFDAVGKLSDLQKKRLFLDNNKFFTVKSPIKERKEDLIFLKELIEIGKIKAFIDKKFSLNEIVKAHSYVDKGHKKGNVIITV